MRLIDADHLIQIVCGATILPDGFKNVFRKLVVGEPTIDRPTRSQFKRMAVQLGYEPVVRCRECKEHRLFNGRDMCAKNATILDGHEVGLRATRADFYCADGERRTNER